MIQALKSDLTSKDLAAKLFGQDTYMYKYIMMPNRAKWKKLLPLSKNSIVVDLGCGWGALPLELSKVVKRVIAFDSTLETLQFMEKRLQEEKINNIELNCIDSLAKSNIPLPSNSVDFVILNGVLEWVAKGTNENPEKIQKKVLAEITRILKPNGILITAIENRYGFPYFCGFPDEHTVTNISEEQLKYTTILPRFFSNWLMQKKKKQKYETYTYSYKKYLRIFKATGLQYTRSFAPIPDYRFPQSFIPIDGKFYQKNNKKLDLYFSLKNKNDMNELFKKDVNWFFKLLPKLYYWYLTILKKHNLSYHYFLFLSYKEKDALNLDYNKILKV
ncbi:class I SAM-dependent methyltransferase [Candidatus Margulisiibacteriota bacterium]